jgi:hypothetical protein
MLIDQEAFVARLEQDGEDTVRRNLSLGVYGTPSNLSDVKISFVTHWLKSKDDARAVSAENKRDEREEETLRVAREALASAKEANRIASENVAAARDSAASARTQARWAMWAAVIATVAAIVATFKG